MGWFPKQTSTCSILFTWNHSSLHLDAPWFSVRHSQTLSTMARNSIHWVSERRSTSRDAKLLLKVARVNHSSQKQWSSMKNEQHSCHLIADLPDVRSHMVRNSVCGIHHWNFEMKIQRPHGFALQRFQWHVAINARDIRMCAYGWLLLRIGDFQSGEAPAYVLLAFETEACFVLWRCILFEDIKPGVWKTPPKILQRVAREIIHVTHRYHRIDDNLTPLRELFSG